MPKLLTIWNYRNEPAVVILSIVAVVLVAFILVVIGRQLYRGAPIICKGVWLPPSAEMCRDEIAISAPNASPPIGAILPYFGVDNDLPDNWIVCDGRDLPAESRISIDANEERGGNQIPDLRSRFVRGATRELVNQSIAVGGSDSIDLSHSHLWARKVGNEWRSYNEEGEFVRVDDWSNGIGEQGEGNRPLSNDASLNLHTDKQGIANASNLPPYVELRYIIRIF